MLEAVVTIVKGVPNGMQPRRKGVRGVNPFWSLRVVKDGVETNQYIKKGFFGRIRLVEDASKATRWRDVGKMVVWARDERPDLAFEKK